MISYSLDQTVFFEVLPGVYSKEAMKPFANFSDATTEGSKRFGMREERVEVERGG